METETHRRIALFALAVLLMGSPVSGSGIQAERISSVIDLSNVLATNIRPISTYLKNEVLDFRTTEASPPDAEFFFLRYGFTLPEGDRYRLAIQGREPGTLGWSRYSYVIDDGPVRDVIYRRVVNGPRERVEGKDVLKLSAGEHALELRFYPDQQVRVMNRADKEHQGHVVNIKTMRLVPVRDEEPTAAPTRTRFQKLVLKHGDTVLFLGDSITNEEFFPGHFERMLRKAYPDEAITCYNTGVSNNRTWEGLARLEEDVLPLEPTWVIVNFGVNDCLHMAPDEFGRTHEKIILRLKEEGIRVLCTTPTGFLPERDKDGRWFHTRDRAQAFDRTVAQEAGVVIDLAQKHNCLWADTLGAFTQCDLPRDRLMYNQWHPNSEGGRLMALSILRALGFSKSDVAKTQDPTDMEYFRILERIPEVNYPSYGVRRRVSARPAAAKMVVATSCTRNALYAFSAEDGRQIARVPVGHHPMGVAYSAKRAELYVACEAVGRIEVICARSFDRKEPILLGDVYPISIVLTEDEDTAWTGNFFAASVSEIDLDQRNVKREIRLGGAVESVILLEKHEMLVAGTKSGVVAVDTSTGQVTKTLPIDYVGALIRRSEDEIGAIDTASWQMHVLTVPELTLKTTTASPFRSRAVVTDDETDRLWAGDWENHRLVRMTKTSGELRAIADVEFPLGLAIVNGVVNPRDSDSSYRR